MTDVMIDIGTLRRKLFMPYDCSWNGLVRDVTAKCEQPGGLVSMAEVQGQLNRHCALLMQAQEFAAAASPQAPAPAFATNPTEQRQIDIINLRLYARLAEENEWKDEAIHWSVFQQTLGAIADRLERLPLPGASPGLELIVQYPVKLNKEIDKLCDEWSDEKQLPGMWGNSEAIKFNLHTFARAVLSRSLEGHGGEPLSQKVIDYLDATIAECQKGGTVTFTADHLKTLRDSLTLPGEQAKPHNYWPEYNKAVGELDALRRERDEAAFFMEVLRLANEHDCTNDLIWNEEDGKLSCAVICSDEFWWGCCDAEPLTPETLPVYRQALEECAELEKTLPKNSHMFPRLYADELFAARMRKMRPQGDSYEMYPPVMWHLFDACGPVRDVGMGNPHPQPTNAEAWEAKFKRRTSDKERAETAESRAAQLETALRQVLNSARPNEKEHPTMFAAWKVGEAALSAPVAQESRVKTPEETDVIDEGSNE